MFSTMFTLYPQNKQQIIAILVGVIATLAAALGPHMGGWISEEFGWRFIFIINAPFSFILGVIVLRFSNFTEKEYFSIMNYKCYKDKRFPMMYKLYWELC